MRRNNRLPKDGEEPGAGELFLPMLPIRTGTLNAAEEEGDDGGGSVAVLSWLSISERLAIDTSAL